MTATVGSTQAAGLPPIKLGLIVGCASVIAMMTFGLRAIMGLFMAPLSEANLWDRDVFAFALALQNLIWGLGQPFAGVVVDRFGAPRVLAAGGFLYAAGIALMPYATTPLTLNLTAGLLMGLGLSGASFVTVIGALGHLVPEAQRAWALGVATAASSLGQFLFAPLGQAFIDAFGWQSAALILAGLLALVPLLSLALRRRTPHAAPAGDVGDVSVGAALGLAFRNPSYVLLLLGFSVCGFQLAFITVHLVPYLNDQGVDASVAAWALGLIGLVNIVGSYMAGVISGRYSKRILLVAIYLARAAVTAAFLLLPMSPPLVLLFGAAMGLLWLSTVPPTSGLVASLFGTRYVAMLFGLVFLSHQIGSFLGVWWGGTLYAQTGSYTVVWWLTVAAGVLTAFVHWPIREPRPAPRLAAA